MRDGYRLAPGVSMNEIEGKTVLFSIKTGDSYGLNASAAVMLRAVLERGFNGAKAHCEALFEVDPAELAADLSALVAELSSSRLLVESRSPSAE